MLLERSVNQYLADKNKMTTYICERITVEGMRIELAYGEGEGPVWAILVPTWNDGYGWGLQIESNEPEWVSVEEVYNYFRRKDMTSLERQQELLWEMNRYTDLPFSKPTAPTEIISKGSFTQGMFLVEATPYWDADLGELWFGDKLIKAYREEAENQTLALAAFQTQEWRHRIDDPIIRHAGEPTWRRKRRLRDTITGLNANHITPGLIRFRGDGTGKGIRWTRCH